jgi:hypothetical protein
MKKVVEMPTGMHNTGSATIVLDSANLPTAIQQYPNGSVHHLELVRDGKKETYHGSVHSVNAAFNEITAFVKMAASKENSPA